MAHLVVKAGQEALELPGVLALPSPGLLLVGPLALQKGLCHAQLQHIQDYQIRQPPAQSTQDFGPTPDFM